MNELTKSMKASVPSSQIADRSAAFPFPVVAIGASAGGVEAVGELLQHLPAHSGAAFLVVLHLDPERESHLAEVFGRRTKMPVVQIDDRMRMEPNRVHVIAPNFTLTLENTLLRLSEPSQGRAWRRPVDEMFQSLADCAGERAVAVVMSGTGTNGTAGLAEIKANHGVVFAQEPSTAAFDGMPRSAIDSGLVDQVLSPERLAETIAGYVRSAGVAAAKPEGIDESVFLEILKLLRDNSQLELRSYRRPTLGRRINRRMSLRGLRNDTEYLGLLREDADERQTLINDLMINVTSFFRDAESWEALETRVIAPLIESKERGSEIRCWVPACSTGEEAYTLAILLTEHAQRAAKNFDIKIFGTDLSKDAITRARAGLFADGIAIQVSPERLESYFDWTEDRYRIKKVVREKVTFAPHNLLADPPFSRLDLVTCRNVLIYLEPEVQRKVLNMLNFALRPNGVLMLGNAESVKRGSGGFESINQKHKIFRQAGPTRNEFGAFPVVKSPTLPEPTAHGAERRSPRNDIGAIALHAVAGLTSAAALLDSRQRVLYFHGDTDRYLAHPHGKADLDVYAMARAGLEAPIRNAVNRARHDKKALTVAGRIAADGKRIRVSITATPVERDDFVLLSFHEEGVDVPLQREKVPEGEAHTAEGKSTELLREELRQSHLELARTVDDLEKTNEDLTASNEQVMSINEELQSSNEELETSKEELQSLNEELATVNSQLQTKLDELEATSNNLANLLKSSDIATLFLSRDLEVQWFTPAVANLFSLIEADIGRSITDFARKFDDNDLRKECEQVLKTLVPTSREVRDADGRWWLRRTNPYRTSADKIEGIVMTFLDISDNKLAERKARQAALRARKAAAAKDEFLARLSHELRTPLQPALLGLSGLSARDDMPPDVLDKISSITRNIEIEIRLIDDLLDLTRVGHGKLRLRRERLDALDLLQDSVRLCQEESAEKKLDVTVDGAPGEAWIKGDRIRLQQVIWNLLRNAIHFTRENGGVATRCERLDNRIMVEVADNGVGMPANLLPKIFESFERSDETFSGLGLGLSIAKSLVEAHDGTIEAESEGVGRGSTFRVWLPAAEAPAQAVAAVTTWRAASSGSSDGQTDLSGLGILVIEDHPDSAKMLAALLQAAGCNAATAATKKEALAAMETTGFDLILSDIALADGSAYDLVDSLPRGVPVIALSGYGAPQDVERSIEAGFAEHLVKPVTFAELKAAIAQALGR